MHTLDFIEKFSALASGSFSSWPSITTNVFTIVILFLARNIFHPFYVTLQSMDNLLANITVLLFGLTLYGIIYRSVSGVFKTVQQYRDAKNKKLEDSRRFEALKESILNLSKSEISILKFFIQQSLHATWLPDEDTSVILLERKNIIRNVDFTRTKIVDFWHGSSRNISCNLYQITDDARKLLTEMHNELSRKWRNVKASKTFADFQKL